MYFIWSYIKAVSLGFLDRDASPALPGGMPATDAHRTGARPTTLNPLPSVTR